MKRSLLLAAIFIAMVSCSAPNTNDWSSEDRQDFLIQCDDNGEEPALCLCALEALEENYTDQAHFFQEEAKGGRDFFLDAVDKCRADLSSS